MDKEQKLLKSLQKIDLRTEELKEEKENLPEFEELKLLKNELKEDGSKVEENEAGLKEEESKQKKLEGELDLLNIKIKKEEDKLYGGSITNPKELQDIQGEVSILKRKKDEMETELLEQMDVVDGLLSEKDTLSKRIGEIKGKTKELEKKLSFVSSKLEKEIKALYSEREKAASKISPDALSLYEELKEEILRPAVVNIEEGICQGCHTELPAEEVDKIISSSKLWQCPHCRRILIREKG